MSADQTPIRNMTMKALVRITFSTEEERQAKIRAIERSVVEFCKDVGGPNPEAQIIVREVAGTRGRRQKGAH